MHILGIDPGYGRLGYGVVSVERDVVSALEFGCMETEKDMPHAERLLMIRVKILELIERHAPLVLGIEKLFFAKNVTTALKVAEARGVILATAAEKGILIVECSPQEVKMAVTGYGNAEKQQVQEMVRIFLRLKSVPKPDDAADAVAIAIAASRMMPSTFGGGKTKSRP